MRVIHDHVSHNLKPMHACNARVLHDPLACTYMCISIEYIAMYRVYSYVQGGEDGGGINPILKAQ
jgi:hypothetical protein